MKLIALRNFRNTRNLDLDGDGKFDPETENQVHKGQVFTIGGAKPFEALSKNQQAIVHQLNQARCVGDAEDTKLAARIKEEVAEETKSAQTAAKASAAGGNEHLVKVIVETLAGLGLLKPAAAK
jgi:hypothetical protein